MYKHIFITCGYALALLCAPVFADNQYTVTASVKAHMAVTQSTMQPSNVTYEDQYTPTQALQPVYLGAQVTVHGYYLQHTAGSLQ